MHGTTTDDDLDDTSKSAAAAPYRAAVAAAIRRRDLWWRFRYGLFPGLCRCCGLPSDVALDLCATCAADLPWITSCCRRCGMPSPYPRQQCAVCDREAAQLDRTVALFSYAPPVDAVVADLKFHARLATAEWLGELLAARLLAAYQDDQWPQLLVPVPLSLRRLLARGHDQAALLARRTQQALARHGYTQPLAMRLLRRARHTAPQSDRSATERRRAMARAFRVHGRTTPRHVALLDDVFTTGATLAAAASALRSVGVQRIDAWVVARTVPAGPSFRG